MMHELASELHSQGHDVLVVTPDSYQNYRYLPRHLDILEGVKVLRFPSGRLKNIPKPIRLVNELLLPFRAWRAGKAHFANEKIDLVICYSPSIFWGWLVYKLKKLWIPKTYLILRDIFPQWAIDNGILKKNSPLTKFFLFMERFQYNQADIIGLMSRKNLEWFRNYFSGKEKLEVLYNWASDRPIVLDSKFNTTDQKSYRRQLGLEDKVVFFYGGNIGHAQDMSQILRLALKLKDFSSAHFLLVGAGDEVDLVRNFIQSENLSNITRLDPIPQDEFQKMMIEFDVGLFCLNRNHSTHNFPGKILGYLVQGLPILGSVNPGNDLKEVIEEANVGFVVIAGEDERFAQSAVSLLDKELRKKMGTNSKQLVTNKFSTKSACHQILSSVLNE